MMKWRGDLANKIVRDAADKALRKGAEGLLSEAVDETPILTGTLRRSGAVTHRDGKYYVSFNTPYARKQHEDTTLRHPRGGKAKYLEDPFKRNKQKINRMVLEEVQKALKKG